MASNTTLVTTNYKVHAARQILESIEEQANSAYYVFTGSHVPYPQNNDAVPPLYQNEYHAQIQPYQDMIQGKRVKEDDLRLLVRKVVYTSNKVYKMYDDKDDYLSDSDFYVMVDEIGYWHVYKCLDNNLGRASTISPSFAVASTSDNYKFRLADGYVWKYLYSVSATDHTRFSTERYFPVYANTVVELDAIDGALDTIKIENAGKGYDNYLNGTFSASDIKVNGNLALYAISSSTAATVNGFYTDCILYISTGLAAGQYKTIVNYISNINGKFAVLDTPFDISPTNGTQYQINPKVEIVGSGRQSVNAIARALINSTSSNSVSRIEMIKTGTKYNYATARVLANAVVDVDTAAILRPILPPSGGHGSDVARELFASRLCFSVKFANNETNKLLTYNKFQQVGIIKDPLFQNVKFDLLSATTNFVFQEPLYKISPKRFQANVVTNLANNIFTCSSAQFNKQLAANDWVYITSSNTDNQIVQVNSVTNSTSFIAKSNSLFTSNSATISYANVTMTSNVSDVFDIDTLFVTNLSGVVNIGDTIIGGISGAMATVNAISRNDQPKNFDTFVQLNRYEGIVESGTFVPDEWVYQTVDNTTTNRKASGSLFHVNASTMFVSNQVGLFDVVIATNTVIGNTSSAVFLLNNKYDPELVFGSGDILYLNNIEPVNRSNTTSEVFKIILEF